MKKTMHKRIIGLLVFIFALAIFTPCEVFASEACDTAKKYFENNAFDRYGLSLEFTNDVDQYELKMDKSSTKSSYFKDAGITNPKLKITRMQFFTQDDKPGKSYSGSQLSSILGKDTISPGDTIKINRNNFGSDILDVFKIYFKPDGFMDPDLKTACGDTADFEMMIYVIVQKGKSMGAQQPFTYNLSGPSTAYMEIDCNNYQSKFTPSSFEYNFCNDRQAAINAGARVYTYDNNHLTYASKYASETKSGMIELKCDYKVKRATQGIFKADGKTPNPDYYTNKSYIRGIGTIEITEGNYNYNIEGKTETSLAKCKVKCEEVVVAEYGPPIASKAGLCFEYKVKVTSRVSCSLEEGPTKPKEPVVCTPLPYCVSKSGKARAQGGPNEDFDKCVNKCDGGVYSDKCVDKCYKKVYGKSTSVSKTSVTGKEVSYAEKVYNENEPENSCKYDRVNGNITWYVGDGTHRVPGVTCDPYWHRKNSWGIAGHNYIYYKTGIPASDICNDTCYWVDEKDGACGDSNYVHYLNHPEVYSMYHKGVKSPYEKDIEANTEIYETLKKRCEAYATCNTTTAEFTISVEYSTKNNPAEIKTIDFPFSTKIDTIKYNNEESTSCTGHNNDTTILSSAGCYDCDKATSKKFYQTEWSFPGSWIHNKTGELTFDKSKVNNKYWQEQKNKFCLPLNIKNVNEKWYNYYYAKVYGNNKDIPISYNDTNHTSNIICPAGTKLTDISCNYQKTEMTDNDINNIKYNISAMTKKFGFFEWDLSIKCFYAVNSEFPQIPENESSCKPTCVKDDDDSKSTEKYRIRTVDLANLFPDKDGNKLANTDDTGRTPGFNWTKYSSQEKKDPNYTSLPSQYTKWIQAKGYSVYSDDYLDYEINLTKDKINKLKNNDTNYTKWDGSIETDSVNHYISKDLREKLSDSKFPQTAALKCNNMKNYRSTECEDFKGEVK